LLLPVSETSRKSHRDFKNCVSASLREKNIRARVAFKIIRASVALQKPRLPSTGSLRPAQGTQSVANVAKNSPAAD